jgi:hypothetical protein
LAPPDENGTDPADNLVQPCTFETKLTLNLIEKVSPDKIAVLPILGRKLRQVRRINSATEENFAPPPRNFCLSKELQGFKKNISVCVASPRRAVVVAVAAAAVAAVVLAAVAPVAVAVAAVVAVAAAVAPTDPPNLTGTDR